MLGKNEKKILRYAYNLDKLQGKHSHGIDTSNLRYDNLVSKGSISSVPMKSLARKGYLKEVKNMSIWKITEKGKKKAKEIGKIVY